MKDLRTKNAWEKHNNVKGATGVKIVGRGDDIEKALAGLPLYVARREDEVEFYKNELEREIQHALKVSYFHDSFTLRSEDYSQVRLYAEFILGLSNFWVK